jgi:2,3-bisphosphoglycerate-independent phosphoglycerate mutase
VNAERPGGKAIVLILDGLGDLPIERLGGLTPLEAADTPILDRFARCGEYGLVDPIAPGVIPNTHNGVGMILGLEPAHAVRLKRGPVEAFGAGTRLENGDVAFRANFATLERFGDRFFVADRRAGRITSEAPELASLLEDIDLGDGVRARFQSTDQHRGALIFRGPGLAAEVSDTDPGDGRTPAWLEPCRARDEASRFTAGKVNDFIAAANERLRDHEINQRRTEVGRLPANGVITRGAGAWFEVNNVLNGRGVATRLVAGCNTVYGLANIFGMDTVRRREFTASTDTDVRGKFEAARHALDDSDLVFVHIKATDLFSHDFQPLGKRDFIERVDRELAVFDDCDAVFALTADHTTDSNTGAHTADPVPVLIYDPRSPRSGKGAVTFGESACRQGNLPRQTGHEFLGRVIAQL